MDILIISVLILLGLLFCVMEILILPGLTIAAILSTICSAQAIYMAFDRLGSGAGIIVVVAIITVDLIAIVFSLRAKTWDRLSLKSEIDSSSSLEPKEALKVGDCAVTLSRLSPMGKIEVEGKAFEAKSNGGYIDAHVEVEVVGFENFSVIVKEIK